MLTLFFPISSIAIKTRSAHDRTCLNPSYSCDIIPSAVLLIIFLESPFSFFIFSFLHHIFLSIFLCSNLLSSPCNKKCVTKWYTLSKLKSCYIIIRVIKKQTNRLFVFLQSHCKISHNFPFYLYFHIYIYIYIHTYIHTYITFLSLFSLVNLTVYNLILFAVFQLLFIFKAFHFYAPFFFLSFRVVDLHMVLNTLSIFRRKHICQFQASS